jgi:plasmid stability protein
MPRVAKSPKEANFTRIGFAYVPQDMKDRLEARAKCNYRSLSQEMRRIIEESLAREEEGQHGQTQQTEEDCSGTRVSLAHPAQIKI